MNEINQLDLEKRTVRKVMLRIVPYVFLLYIIAIIDRVNIGYAALEMNREIGITAEVFGFVSGIFFIGYFLFEIPSNVFLNRFGARKWIARIMVTWGVLVIAEGFVQNGTQLAIVRFLLGIAEAGFTPGVLLYLTFWFRTKDQARAVAYFMSGMAAANIIGAPFSTWIMENITWFELSGWRWIFIIQGIPAILLGVITFFYLTDRPVHAKWLQDDERNWLIEALKQDDLKKQATKNMRFVDVLKDFNVWRLSAIYFTWVVGLYGIGLWLPTIVREFSEDLSNTQVGLIAIIPYLFGGACMILWGGHSDRKGERKWHTALPLGLGGISLVILGTVADPTLSVVLLTLTTIGLYSFMGPFWSVASMTLSASAAVVGIAIINSVGNLGGFIGPYIVGYLRDFTGKMESGLFFLGAVLIIGTLIITTINRLKVNRLTKDNE